MQQLNSSLNVLKFKIKLQKSTRFSNNHQQNKIQKSSPLCNWSTGQSEPSFEMNEMEMTNEKSCYKSTGLNGSPKSSQHQFVIALHYLQTIINQSILEQLNNYIIINE